MVQTLKKYAPWVIVLLCVLSALWSWYHPKEVIRTNTEWREVTKEVKVKVLVPVHDGKVESTGAVLQENPVLAKADCPPSRGGSEVVTTLTPSTGEAHILIKPKEPSLFAFEDQKELGIRYNGIKGGLYGRWTFVRVGNLYGALYGEINTKPDSFVGAEVSYRW